MPQYSLNPNAWVKPADTTGAYSKGFGLGLQGGELQARLAMERARLAHDSQRTSVELALKQQQNERDNLIEQQKLEVAKAYHQQETDLKARQLDQAEQLMKEKLQHAAEETMAISNYRNAIANGEDPARAALTHLIDVKGTNSMLAAAIRSGVQSPSMLPQYTEFDIGGGNKQGVIFSPKTGTPHLIKAPTTPTMTPAQAGALLKKSEDADAEIFGGDAQLKQYQQGLLNIIKGSFKGGNTAPHPLEGKIVKDKRDGTINKVINGVPVPTSVLSNLAPEAQAAAASIPEPSADQSSDEETDTGSE